MKILLQSEAETISNKELLNNQKYLIDLLTKIYRLYLIFFGNFAGDNEHS